jgi:hypothetical protein
MNTRLHSIVKELLRSSNNFQQLLLNNAENFASMHMLISSHVLLHHQVNIATVGLEHAHLHQLMQLQI